MQTYCGSHKESLIRSYSSSILFQHRDRLFEVKRKAKDDKNVMDMELKKLQEER